MHTKISVLNNLCRIPLSILFICWASGIAASDFKLSSKYQDLALQLSVNPGLVEVELNSLIYKPRNAYEQAQVYLLLSKVYNQKVDPDNAIKFANLGLELVKLKDHAWLYHRLNLAKAEALDLAGSTEEGLLIANNAVNWAKQNRSESVTIEALCKRGIIFNTLMDSANALTDLQLAYSLASTDDPIQGKGYISGLIALVYEYRRDDANALMHFLQAERYHRRLQQWQELSEVLFGMGRANVNLRHYALGRSQLEESQQLASKINDEQGVAYVLKELGSLEQRLGNYEASVNYYKDALKSFIKVKNRYLIIDITIALARIELLRKSGKSIIKLISEAETYLIPESMLSAEISLLRLKADAYALNSEFEKAYILSVEIAKKLKILQSTQNKEMFYEQATKFELDKKQATNELLLKNNQFLTAVVILSVIVSSLLIYILYRSKQSKKALEKLAEIDGLTNTFNRRKTFELVASQLELSKRHQFELCLATLDLDYFKKINDEFGHSKGDKVLREFSNLCQNTIRKTDILGRIGGEEFLIAFPLTSLTDAIKILEKLRTATRNLSSLLALGNLETSVSIGISMSNDSDTVIDLFNRADALLYRAKNAGRDQVHY